MNWRDDMNDVEPQCPACKRRAVVVRFVFPADGSFVGVNWCKRCKGHFIAVYPLSDILERIRENERRGIMTPDDCLTDSKTNPLTQEEVNGFAEGWDNGVVWEELLEDE